jgi:hypothetical protein
VIGWGCVAQLAGGQVTGAGTLTVGDGAGGELDIVTDTQIPNLVLAGNGIIAPAAGGAVSSSTAPSALTVTDTLAMGYDPATPSSSCSLLGRLTLGPEATGTVSGQASVSQGCLSVQGWLSISDKAVLQLVADSGAPPIVNTGHISLTGSGSIVGGAVSSSGLIEKVGSATASLETLLTSTGAVAVSAGTLVIGGDDWTISDGVMTLTGSSISSSASGGIVFSGGAQGGILSGLLTVGATVSNGGRIEPLAPGLTLSGGYTQATGETWFCPRARRLSR